MATYSFKTPVGQTINRDLLILYLNTGTSDAPVWSAIGKRVEDSSIDFDWSTETKQDILGGTYTTGKKATRTQTFDPCELDSGDAALKHIWELAMVEDDINALLNQDLLLVHYYTTDETDGNSFAERFPASAILPTSLGGEGGGNIGMPIDVTYGGVRQKGGASIENGVVTFIPESNADAE